MVLGRALERVAEAFGYQVVAKRRASKLPHARKLRLICQRYAISAALDIGANRGQFRDFLRSDVGFQGPVHSFEPVSALAAGMAARRGSDATWHIHDYALGPEAGSREINVMAASDFSSFLAPRDDVTAAFAPKNAVQRTERVEVRTLDAVAAALGIDPPRTFVKIDTQGWDLEVARGGRDTLSKVAAIQTEVSVRPIYRGMPDYAQTLAFFSELGFHLSDFFIVSSDERLRAIEFDCLMVRG